MAAMVASSPGKVEHDQRVAGNFGRTGENRTRRPNFTELKLGWWPWVGQGGRKQSVRVASGRANGSLQAVTRLGLRGGKLRRLKADCGQPTCRNTCRIAVIECYDLEDPVDTTGRYVNDP